MKKNIGPRLLTILLAGLAMVGPFSIDTYLPSFPAIAHDLQVDEVLVQQTLSVYLLSFSFMMLFHGTLSDSFGRRPVILIALVVYIAASVGAVWSPTLHWLLVFRGLQGMSAGAGVVIGRAIVRDRMAGADAQRALAPAEILASDLNAASAPVFAVVKTFWMIFPYSRPRVFVHVSSAIRRMATSCAVESDRA